jgi:hypothetical protein
VQPSSHLIVRSQSAPFSRTKSAAEVQAEQSIELIRQLKAVRTSWRRLCLCACVLIMQAFACKGQVLLYIYRKPP